MRRRICCLGVLLLLVAAGCSSPTVPAEDGALGLKADPFITSIARAVATGLETLGVFIILVGTILSSFVFLREWTRGDPFSSAYVRYRKRLGQGILLGLELFLGADIIGTVAIAPTFRNVGTLAALVLIRTFLSLALEVEIQGNWPWCPLPPMEGVDDT